jgi:hypothetical protein
LCFLPLSKPGFEHFALLVQLLQLLLCYCELVASIASFLPKVFEQPFMHRNTSLTSIHIARLISCLFQCPCHLIPTSTKLTADAHTSRYATGTSTTTTSNTTTTTTTLIWSRFIPFTLAAAAAAAASFVQS